MTTTMLWLYIHKEGTYWKKKMSVFNGRADWSIHGKTMVKVPKYDASSGIKNLKPA